MIASVPSKMALATSLLPPASVTILRSCSAALCRHDHGFAGRLASSHQILLNDRTRSTSPQRPPRIAARTIKPSQLSMIAIYIFHALGFSILAIDDIGDFIQHVLAEQERSSAEAHNTTAPR